VAGVESAVSVKVAVWTPYVPDRSMTFHSEAELMLLGPETLLQRETYSWHPREDIWGGLVDSDQRLSLSERLRTDFDPLLPPSERSMSKLNGYLVEMEKALSNSEWTDSALKLDSDGTTPVRLNPRLAFYVHMKWIHKMFQHYPSASVSIR